MPPFLFEVQMYTKTPRDPQGKWTTTDPGFNESHLAIAAAGGALFAVLVQITLNAIKNALDD